MDTLKILLGATVALLLGALAVSYINLGPAPAGSSSAEDLVQMKRQLAELQLEQERLETARQRRVLEEAAAQAPPPPQAAPASAELEAMKEQLALLQEEKDKAERDAERADREAAFVGGKVLESRDKEARRARMIKDALLIARVKEWIEDPQLGGFATIEIIMPENVQPGSILCVRRNTGILGKLRVGEMSIEGAIANPVAAFPDARPQPGDELILEPPF
jgi:phage host-nuclease inhibitor protein Gam